MHNKNRPQNLLNVIGSFRGAGIKKQWKSHNMLMGILQHGQPKLAFENKQKTFVYFPLPFKDTCMGMNKLKFQKALALTKYLKCQLFIRKN
jgi:hypothetical protein